MAVARWQKSLLDMVHFHSFSLNRREWGDVNECISTSTHPLLMETSDNVMFSICFTRTGEMPVSEEVMSVSLYKKQQHFICKNKKNCLKFNVGVCHWPMSLDSNACRYGSEILRKVNSYLIRTKAEPGSWFCWVYIIYMPRELVSWCFYSFMSFCNHCLIAVLCYLYGSEMVKTLNRLRLSGCFFVGKWLVRQIYTGCESCFAA